MGALFYIAIILSLGLLAPFVFDDFTFIRYALLATLIIHLIALAISTGPTKTHSRKTSTKPVPSK